MSNSTLARILFNLLFFTLGIAAYILGLFRLKTDALTSKVLTDFGLGGASASLIFFIFNWINERSQLEATEKLIGDFLDRAVKDIFQRPAQS